MGFGPAEGTSGCSGFSSAQGTGHGFSPAQGVEMVSGFTPSDIAGLKGWWDFSDISSLFQLSNGTTAVTADADPIGYAADKSGNGKHMIQAAAGQRPLFKVNVKNNRPCALFASASAQVLAVGSSVGAESTFTMFCVLRSTTSGNNFMFVNGSSATGGAFHDHSGTRDFQAVNVAFQDDAAISNALFEQWIGTHSVAPLWVLRVNGAGTAVSPNDSAINVPASATIGGTGSGGQYHDGYIAECGIYNTVLSAGNITLLETYLNSKWAVY